MIGLPQEQWLDGAMANSRAQWNVIAQQTIFSRFGTLRDGEMTRWTDGWDGYPATREHVLGSIEAHRVRNPLILGGDMALDQGLAFETQAFAVTVSTEDMQEGTRAFMEKRPAQFHGR